MSRKLRILLDPVYITAANLSGSSTYRRFTMIAKELVSRGHYVYWLIPDRDNYTPDPIEDNINVGVIRTRYIQDQFIVDGLTTQKFFDLFNKDTGKYTVDLVCTCRNSLVWYYKEVLKVPTIIIEDFVQTRKDQYVSKSYWLMQCLGYLSADCTIFPSKHNISAVIKEMLIYFSKNLVQTFAKNKAVNLPVGISCKELSKVYSSSRWKVEKGFRVVSIGRIFGKSYLEYLPWFDYLFRSGISDVQLTISLSGALSGPMKGKLRGIGFDLKNLGRQFIVLNNNNRKNYITQLKSYHAFICPLSHSDHPAGLMEAVFMGVPGIIPASDYQQTFFKDYPFVINPRNKAEFLSTLLWIRDNKREAREIVLPWRKIIEENYEASDSVKHLVKVMEDTISKFKHKKLRKLK